MIEQISVFYALLIGINDYPSNPLSGCINDVLAIDDYFSHLCNAQREKVVWNPFFVLAPLENEKKLLQQRNIRYIRPTRQNIINAFSHLQAARPESGDYCLLYYSGHGSSVSTLKVPLFEDYEASGKLQTLVCLDEDIKSQKLYHLLDKELGYLIAKTLKPKNRRVETSQPALHFISMMDCCHSGTNTREVTSVLKARVYDNKGVHLPAEPFGFTRAGNCFYLPLKKNQSKVLPGGITNARHISLAAAQNSEAAYELSVVPKDKKEQQKAICHGIFTISLLKTLQQQGTNISYSALIQHIRMRVQVKVANQVPHLDSMLPADTSLYFLKNQFSPAKQEYLIAYREKPIPEWVLNAGDIQGIYSCLQEEKIILQLTDHSKRIIKIKEIRPTESVLESDSFSDKDKLNSPLSATILQITIPKLNIAFGKDFPLKMQEQIRKKWKNSPLSFLKLVDFTTLHQLEINITDHNGPFILTSPKSKVPFFKPQMDQDLFLQNANKVARYKTIINRTNHQSMIRKEDFEIIIKVLEGELFDHQNLNEIPLNKYRLCPPNPERVLVQYKKISERYCQPAIKVSIRCLKPRKQSYWIGALFCDHQFGITDQYLQIQRIGKSQSDIAKMEYVVHDNGIINRWSSIPLLAPICQGDPSIAKGQDYIIFYISDAPQPFSLSQYNQEKISFEKSKEAGFNYLPTIQENSWCTIKIPIKIIQN